MGAAGLLSVASAASAGCRAEATTTASPALAGGPQPRSIAAPVAALVTPVIHALPVSATLAANEAMAARLRRGQPVLPLAFGEAGLPVHPVLRAALATSATCNSYGPVAGLPELRAAAAGYWQRRGLPTTPGSVIGGPGSKALLFALMLAIGGDAAIPRPSWVSYAAQARLLGIRVHLVAV